MLALVRRLVTLWLAVSVVFFALRVIPGDAVQAQFEGGADQNLIKQRRAELGLDQPVFVQYAAFIADLVKGDFGTSYFTQQPVTEMIGQQIGATLVLAISAWVVSIILGLGLGVAGGLSSRGWPAYTTSIIISLMMSTPIYWSGIITVLIFSVFLGWFPPFGTGGVEYLILPVAVLGIQAAGGLAKVTQANIRAVTGAPFIITARSKGLNERQIITRHMLRAALIPSVGAIALQIGFLLGGTVIIETLFLRPGLGRLMLDAVTRRDYPVIQGLTLLSAFVYMAINTLAEMLYPLFDPRLRHEA